MTVNWTYDGTAAGAIVVMNAVNPVDVDPSDGTDYSLVANSVFGDVASDIGGNNYVVFAGIGTSVGVTGLTEGTVYNVKVYTYSGSGDDVGDAKGINYQYDGALTGAQVAADPPLLSNPQAPFATIDINSADMSADIDSDEGDAITDHGVVWSTLASPVIGGPGVTQVSLGAYAGLIPDTFTAIAVPGLPEGTRIYHRGYAINSIGTGYTPTDFTFFTEPNAALNVNFTAVEDQEITLNWTDNSTNTDTAIVLVKVSNPVDAGLLTDGVVYTPPVPLANYDTGQQLGVGNYVIFAGSGTSATIYGLTSGVTYHVAVYSYSGSLAGEINYQQDIDLSAISSQRTVIEPTLSAPTKANMEMVSADLGCQWHYW
jgi:hypothetical protein